VSEVQEPRPDGPAAPPVSAGRPEVRPPDDRSPEELRADLGELRVELGETVQELAHRVDVPAQLRAKREEATERVQQQVAHARKVVADTVPVVDRVLRERRGAVAAGAAVVGFLLLLRLRRRRARKRAES
jgi:transposase-like protein